MMDRDGGNKVNPVLDGTSKSRRGFWVEIRVGSVTSAPLKFPLV